VLKYTTGTDVYGNTQFMSLEILMIGWPCIVV